MTFTVSDVAGPQQIEAVFTETEIRKTEVTELFNGNEAVRVTEEDQTYVFARDAKVDFKRKYYFYIGKTCIGNPSAGCRGECDWRRKRSGVCDHFR